MNYSQLKSKQKITKKEKGGEGPRHHKRITMDGMSSRNDILMDTLFKFSLPHLPWRFLCRSGGRVRLWTVMASKLGPEQNFNKVPYMVNLRSYSSLNTLLINTRIVNTLELHISFCKVFCFFFPFFRPHPWHMKVLRLGVESELQLPAYTTATATQAESAAYTTAHRNARSLPHGARPGSKPTSSRILVEFITAESR